MLRLVKRFFRWSFSPPPECYEIHHTKPYERKFGVGHTDDPRQAILTAAEYSGIQTLTPWKEGSPYVCHIVRVYSASLPQTWIVVFMFDDISNFKSV